jgi:hypothetical protein
MVRSIVAGWVCIVWALWLGGLGAIFLFVTRLFLVDHDLGAQAAPVLFLVFEKYQLFLAGVALLGTAGLRIAYRSGGASRLFCYFALAAALAAFEPLAITPKIEALRQEGLTHTPDFQRLHGEASTVYVVETLILLAAGFAIPAAIRRPEAKS